MDFYGGRNMQALIKEYGRVILVLIFALIIFLLVPEMGRTLNRSADGLVENHTGKYISDDYFYFYVDGKRYTAYRDVNGNAPTWEDWINDKRLNVDGFVIYKDECGNYYLATDVSGTIGE